MYGKKAGTEKDKNTDEGHDNISHIQLELWAKVHIFWEGHKILQNPLTFVLCSASQK